MQTYPQSPLSTRGGTAMSAPAPALVSLPKRLLALAVSAVLCIGLMPMVPAWADEPAPASQSQGASPASDDATAPVNGVSPSGAAQPDGSTTADDTPAADATAATDSRATAPGADGTTAGPATDGTPDATAVANQDEGSPLPTDDTPVATVDQYFPTDKKAAVKLLKNLTKRFAQGGDESKMNDLAVNAAVALNALGKGDQIDTDAIIKKLAKTEEKAKDGLTLGQYGRYIMMLTAGGVDCTAVKIGSKTRNLVLEMEELSLEADPTIEDAVYMLPVYGNDGYRYTKGLTEDGLIDLILSAQDEDGYFWTDESADTYSIPLTSQALLALLPYVDDDDVADAVSNAGEALADAQLIDGSWPVDGLALEGDIPATAYAVTALAAAGADPVKDLRTSNKSTPLGYLTAHADKALDGYADLDKKADTVTSAAVLMALAANKGFADTKEAFDVYDVQKVAASKEAAKGASTRTTPTSGYRATSSAKTIPQSGDELPLTLGLLILAALGSGAVLLRLRRNPAA